MKFVNENFLSDQTSQGFLQIAEVIKLTYLSEVFSPFLTCSLSYSLLPSLSAETLTNHKPSPMRVLLKTPFIVSGDLYLVLKGSRSTWQGKLVTGLY